MDPVNVQGISTLKVHQVKKIFSSYTHLKLKDAHLGFQPDDTFILGCFQTITRGKGATQSQVVKCTLKEVLDTGWAACFDAYFYEDYIPNLEECLQKIGDQDTWFVFTHVKITKFHNSKKPWADFNLIVKKENIQPKITLLYHSKATMRLLYTSIKDVERNVRQNVIAVVKDIVKPTTTLKNGSKHTMFALVDQSCVENEDLLLHIFFNDSKDYFPEEIEIGDIIRLKSMLGEYFSKDAKMYGKIFNSSALTKYSISEEKDEIIPVTLNSKYVLTDQDASLVHSLFQWWKNAKEKFLQTAPKSADCDPILFVKRVKDIKGPTVFHLYCLVKRVRVIEAADAVILRVTDGSKCSGFASSISFTNATQELTSEIQNVMSNSTDIDIIVLEPLLNKAKALKSDTYVLLKNVTCVNSLEAENEAIVLMEFFMRSEDCEIQELFPNSRMIRIIQRRLRGRESEPESDEEELNNMCTPPNGYRNDSEEENCAKENGGEARSESPNRFSNAPILTKSGIAASTPDRSYSGCSAVLPGHNTSSDIVKETVLQVNSSECKSNGNLVFGQGKKDETRSRKNSMTENNHDLEVKRMKFLWTSKRIRTECDPLPKASLTEFLNNSQNGDCARVWALLKHIHFMSSKPYDSCSCVTCFHDWVWGLCTECGILLDSAQLRDKYMKKDLITKISLPCINTPCSTSCAGDSEGSTTVKHSVCDTVLPIMKLELCLEDLVSDRDFVVDLNGDGAEEFFGLSPSFRWTVDFVDPSLANIGFAIYHRGISEPIQLCLKNIVKSDNTTSFHVFGTRIKFTNI